MAEFTLIPVNQYYDTRVIFTADKVLSFDVIWTKIGTLNHYVYVESKLCSDKIFANKIGHDSCHKLVKGTIGRADITLDYDGSYMDELTITIKDNLEILHQEIFIVDTIGVVTLYETNAPKSLIDNGTVTLIKSPIGMSPSIVDANEIMHKDGSVKNNNSENLDWVKEHIDIPMMTYNIMPNGTLVDVTAINEESTICPDDGGDCDGALVFDAVRDHDKKIPFENFDHVSELLAIPEMSRVIMEDGSYKNIEDVKVGDKLLGASGDAIVMHEVKYYRSKQEIDAVINAYQFTKHDHSIMELCALLAAKSTCNRSKMGAVIAIDEATFITGYNGTLKGFPNDCDDEALVCDVCNVPVDETQYVVGEKHCKQGVIEKRPKSNINVVHAETNAILRAAKNGISVVGKTMYMTTSPCVTCANNIVQSGISRIIYAEEHDDLTGLDILQKAGVLVYKYVPIENNLKAD